MMMSKDLKHEDISYQKILSKIITLLSMEKILWWNNWFWHKTIRRNKRINSKRRWRLYYKMFIRLWIHKKPLQNNSSRFEWTRRIRCQPVRSSINRFCWTIKKSSWCDCWWRIYVCFNDFRKNQRNKTNNLSRRRNSI